MIKQIMPGLYSWSEFSEEKQMDFNGHLIIGKDESVIIDPPELGAEDAEELTKLLREHQSAPLKGILLTNVHHERASDSLRKKFSVPVWVNELDKGGLEAPADHTYKGGDILPCGIEAAQLDDQKSPGETAFYLRDQKTMLVGDAFIGKIPGQLNMLPPDKYQDPAKAKAGLKKLMDYEFSTLLVGDGTSIFQDAKATVATFLA